MPNHESAVERQRQSANGIPSVAEMNARFEARLRMYMGEDACGKRKRDSGDEGEEGDGEDKEGTRSRKLTVRLRFFSREKNGEASRQQEEAGLSNQGQTMTRKPPSSTLNTKSPPKITRQSFRTQAPFLPSSPPATITTITMPPPAPPKQTPFCPHLRVTNEPPIPWDPIPLPCALLPDDHEGPRAAWKRLFPHEEEFGKYGGKPTGWMEKMTWKGGRWVKRGKGDVYIERFLVRG